MQVSQSIVLTLVAVMVFTCGGYVNANTTRYLDDKELITALRQGGFNIYFRHEATNWSQSDNVQKEKDWLSCDGDEMRQLSEAGRNNAMATGQSIKALGIPVGKVLASPYCRTVETARLMQLGLVNATTEVINMRVAGYFGGQAAIVRTAQALLARAPTAGANNVIVAHGNVAQAATPVYPGEGEAVIFRPAEEGGFIVVARVTPAGWRRLSKTIVE